MHLGKTGKRFCGGAVVVLARSADMAQPLGAQKQLLLVGVLSCICILGELNLHNHKCTFKYYCPCTLLKNPLSDISTCTPQIDFIVCRTLTYPVISARSLGISHVSCLLKDYGSMMARFIGQLHTQRQSLQIKAFFYIIERLIPSPVTKQQITFDL